MDPKPNIVVALADDMDQGCWRAFPRLLNRTPDATVVRGVCENPVCGPARASLLTGRHSGRSGVRTNTDAHAGLDPALPTLPMVLQEAGYATHLVGKYLNGYRGTPVGWDAFDEGDGNDVPSIRDRATASIRNHDPARPLFLYLAPVAPHSPHVIPERHADAYPEEPEPQRSRLRECRGVDDMLAVVIATLENNGLWANTALLVLSDNGYHAGGEHGYSTKGTPYREALRVEARVRGPGTGGIVPGALACPQDWPVTLAALAGTSLPGADGLDLGTGVDPEYRLIQSHGASPWRGLAGKDWTYVEGFPAAGDAAYWDHAADPTESVNAVLALDPERRAWLAAETARLAGGG